MQMPRHRRAAQAREIASVSIQDGEPVTADIFVDAPVSPEFT
jgi:hypothetical protein